jgi:hypothetical protein
MSANSPETTVQSANDLILVYYIPELEKNQYGKTSVVEDMPTKLARFLHCRRVAGPPCM